MTLELLGIPTDKWARYAEPLHATAWAPPDTPEYAHMLEGVAWLMGDLADELDRHRRQPDEAGMLSHLLQAEIDGRPIAEEEMLGMAFLLAVGGLDTTAALLSNTLLYLDDHPEDRSRLRDDPELLSTAFDEFMRYFTPTQSLARTVTTDVEIGGVAMKPGQRVFISWAAANRDAEEFERPNEVILRPIPEPAHGFWPRRPPLRRLPCRAGQWAVVMEEILRRLPDYRIERDGVVKYPSVATVYGYRAMPAVFTPGPRVAT